MSPHPSNPTRLVERFFVPFGGSFTYDAGGWLTNPDSTTAFFSLQNADVMRSTDFDPAESVVILGEPGMGKSAALASLQHDRSEIDMDRSVLRVDLANYTAEGRLVADVLEGTVVSSWLEGEGSLSLYLDSLDEAHANIPGLTRLIATYIERWPRERLWVGLSCRTADWPTSLGVRLSQQLGGLSVLELLPLRRVDALRLAPQGSDPEAFIQTIEAANAVALASRPLTLNLLGRTYAHHGGLPSSGAELYELGLSVLCDENDQERRDTSGRPRVSELMSAASWLAALSQLGTRASFWRGPLAEAETSDLTENDWLQPGLLVTADQVDRALRTGLFSGRGALRLGWAHATFAEYLTARWIHTTSLTDEQVSSLLVAEDGSIFPQAQQIAAWLVARDPPRFGWLVRRDPSSFLLNVDIPDPSLRAEAVRSLLDLARTGNLIHDWSQDFRGLSHNGLVGQLESVLTDPTDQAQQIAIDIARGARAIGLIPALARVVNDESREFQIRVSAAMAVYSFRDVATTELLADIARSRSGAGDDSELRGAALLTSWPHAVRTAEVFQLIEVHFPRNYHGIYSMFLDAFSAGLNEADLAAGRAWLDTLGSGVSDSRLSPVVRSLFELAVQHLERPEVVETIANIVRRTMRDGESPLAVFGESISLSDNQRRAIAMELFKTAGDDEVLRIATLFGRGLIDWRDFDWLLEQHETADSELKPNLIRALENVFSPDNPTHANSLLSLPPEHPISERFSYWRTSVNLDSEIATTARQRIADLRELREMRAPAIDNINERIAEHILLARAGDLFSFWQACTLMTITPGTTLSNEFVPDLTSLPRWATLEQATKDGFVAAAETYLRDGSCEPDQWLGQGLYWRKAQAGYRAMLLLNEYLPARLDLLPPQVWREWAPIIVEWPMAIGGTTTEDKERLLNLALPHAREAMTEVLVVLLRTASEAGQHPGRREEMRLLWSPMLSARLRELLPDVEPLVEEEILDAFARFEPDALAELLMGRLSNDAIAASRERAVHALARLLQFRAQSAWSRVSELLVEDAELVKDACLKRCSVHEESPPDLSAEGLATMYLWLEQHFPSDTDPTFDDVHPVGARETLGEWRDSIVRALVSRGSASSVRQVERIAEALPNHGWLRRSVIAARANRRLEQWESLTPKQLLELAESTHNHLVRSARDLMDLSLSVLGLVQARIQGDTPDSPLLWDTASQQPKSEDEVSDYLRNRMNDFFASRGAVVNREVQARRIRPSGIGERVDLRIDAFSEGATSAERPVLTLVGEVKGCWNTDLETSIESQLADRYMADHGSSLGLYIVIWFSTEEWNTSDSRRAVAARRTRAEVSAALNERADALRLRGRDIRIVHLDASIRRPEPD
ncbi:hypothetical protein E3T33_03760 [Cryobacterium sp. TMT1-2-1]|uniref:NACHT domain-containing protein n=1 Tax=Cryobacterium sp. TMT1-2-1 TaxID=1259232 RepID=UPI00106B3227|nr:hypothetical protein [Cryobacterium sp. TMT1-2-1]TFD47151.1 hypothetical protein E3T33_03760 [Cryobacterium sp. TMT1-2-1]